MDSEALRKEKLKEKRIAKVMAVTGWDEKTAYSAYRKAYKKHGIKFADYMAYKFYNIPEEEHGEQWKKIQEKDAKRKERVAEIMRETGWDEETAYTSYRKAYKEHGIRYTDYMKWEFYNIPEFQHKAAWETIQKEKEEQKRQMEEHAIAGVMQKTGWTREETLAQMKGAKKRLQCKPLEYYENRLFEMTEEQQAQVALGADNKKIAALYDTRAFARLQKNKEKTNEYFAEYIRRPWTTNRNITEERFLEIFSDCERIIYKPLYGNKGGGVVVIDLTETPLKDAYQIILKNPIGIIEECIKQHPDMAKLCPDSVNTLRIVTLVSKQKPVTPDGKEMDFVYAAVRVGRAGTVVDDFHSGGMCAAINLANGKIVTDAADLDCHVYPTHPDTGTTFKRFQIPFFEEALEMVAEASKKELVEGLVGWDVAFTENGPLLIEVNTNPGAVLLSTPYAAEKVPTKPVLEKYLFSVKEEQEKEEQKKIRRKQEKAFLELWNQADREITKQAICALFDVPFDGEEEKYSCLRHEIHMKEGCLAVVSTAALEKDPLDKVVLAAAQEAMDAGAKRLLTTHSIPNYPCLVIPDISTRKMVTRILKLLRKQYAFQAVEVTGSYGKTTTTALVNAVLRSKHCTNGFDGENANTLKCLVYKIQDATEETEFFIQESAEAPTFGRPGHISNILRPCVGVITSIGNSHMDRMGSQDNILNSCLTVQKGMPKDGSLVLNGDDPILRNAKVERPAVTYGYKHEDVDYYATNIQTSNESIAFDIVNQGSSTPVKIYCNGIHNVQNATAAFAVGRILGLTPEECAQGLSSYRPQGIRQNRVICNGYHFYLDCYNASGESMRSAIDALETIELPENGRYIAVLADMIGLGDHTEETHRMVGTYLADSKVEQLICYGEEAKHIAAEAAKKENMKIICLDTHQEIAEYLKEHITKDDIVLLKGSHVMELSEVFERFKELTEA